jgi:adenylate kinase family enzyme
MYNPKTSETFPAGTKFDPQTWDKLEKRADDNEKAILKRIELYIEKTMPVIEEYRKEWKLIEINADNCVEWVFNELVEKLGFKK